MHKYVAWQPRSHSSNMNKLGALSLLLAVAAGAVAFSTCPPSGTTTRAAASTQLASKSTDSDDALLQQRRSFLATAATAVAALPLLAPNAAYASGGATAGKYTTIPIAKRRYYGRVQEAVHEFLLMAPAVIKGDLNPTVQVGSWNVRELGALQLAILVDGRNQHI